jgi:hypothetical protein
MTLPAPTASTHAGTAVPSNGPVASSGGGHTVSDLILGLLLSGAFVAALVNIALNRRKSLEDERARVRTTCAEAFQTVAEYKEFPYAIRRRNKDVPAGERVRLSEELRRIQARLSYYTAWMRAEDPRLAAAYDDLVTNLRRLAGTACSDAWLAEAVDADADMNVAASLVDLAGLTPFEDAFIAAVKTHLDGLITIRRLVSLRRSR